MQSNAAGAAANINRAACTDSITRKQIIGKISTVVSYIAGFPPNAPSVPPSRI